MKNSKLKLGVSIGTAILAFMGALFGTYVSGYMQESLWKKNISYEEKRVILNERIKLIEKVSKIINLAPKYKALQTWWEADESYSRALLSAMHDELMA